MNRRSFLGCLAVPFVPQPPSVAVHRNLARPARLNITLQPLPPFDHDAVTRVWREQIVPLMKEHMRRNP